MDGTDHHLGGELHPGRAEVKAGQDLAAHRPHAAVRVADAGAEEQVEQPGEYRVADVLVQPRHRAGLDVVHAVADHHLRALFERGDEARDLVEVVGQVEEGAEMVIGDRMDNIQPGAMPWLHQYVGNPILTGLLNLFFRTSSARRALSRARGAPRGAARS